MRALVTGAGGFVGANLVRALLARGDDPVALSRAGGDGWRLEDLRGEIAIRDCDLRDGEATERVVREERPDVILHLAAHGAYSWQQDFGTMLAVNVGATEALLKGAAAVDAAVVHAGSSSEYGYQDHPAREDEPLRPNSHYAVAKAAATHICRLAAATKGVRTITLRLYSIYGPWEDPGRLMPVLVRHCLAGGWPPLVGRGTARDFVWVDDACDAFIKAATHVPRTPGAVYNVCSGSQTTLEDVVATAADVFEIAAEPEWGSMEQRAWDTSVWVGDPSAAAGELGWTASTPLATGLTALGGWLRDNPGPAAHYD